MKFEWSQSTSSNSARKVALDDGEDTEDDDDEEEAAADEEAVSDIDMYRVGNGRAAQQQTRADLKIFIPLQIFCAGRRNGTQTMKGKGPNPRRPMQTVGSTARHKKIRRPFFSASIFSTVGPGRPAHILQLGGGCSVDRRVRRSMRIICYFRVAAARSSADVCFAWRRACFGVEILRRPGSSTPRMYVLHSIPME